MPLIESHPRTQDAPRSYRPHALLVVGLVAFLAVVSIVGGWVA